MKTHFPWFPMFFLQENMSSGSGDGFFNRCRATFGGDEHLFEWLAQLCWDVKASKFPWSLWPIPISNKGEYGCYLFGWLKSQHFSLVFFHFFPENRMSSPCPFLAAIATPNRVGPMGAGRTITAQRLEALWRTATWPVWRHRRRWWDGMRRYHNQDTYEQSLW